MSLSPSDVRSGPLTLSSQLPIVKEFQVDQGILHLYQSTSNTPSPYLAILSIPSLLTPADLLQFLGSFVQQMSHLHLFKDSLPNRYMAILQMKDQDSTTCFLQEFNGLYHSLWINER